MQLSYLKGGFQMFSNLASAKAAPTLTNAYYSGSPAPSHASAAASSNTATTTPTSAAKNEMMAFFTQRSKENLDIVASVINCLNAFVAGKLDPPRWSRDYLYQIHPDDEEEIDITWQMAMAAFRARRFIKRTSKTDGILGLMELLQYHLICAFTTVMRKDILHETVPSHRLIENRL
ncbi:hypothetical protein Hanom_Chr01g00012621 [Helianthus anomalus]